MVIIHARGNKNIGIGNLSRSYELISYLEKKREVLGIFECTEDLFCKYKKNNIKRSDSLEDSLKIIKKYNCDIYICDLLDADKMLSNRLRKFGIRKIIHLNGLELGFEPDLLIISDSFDYVYKNDKIDIIRGFEYYIVPENVVKNRKKTYVPISKVKNILICFGGADPAFYTEFFSENIKDNEYFYTIILGPAMEEKRKVYIKSIYKKNVKYLDSPVNMVDLILASDLVVTLGGMITYEAMCLGVPVSAVRWKYLEYIVKSFGEKNMINDLGDIKNAYQNMLKLDLDKINDICKNAYKIIDGSSLKNIENILDKIEI